MLDRAVSHCKPTCQDKCTQVSSRSRPGSTTLYTTTAKSTGLGHSALQPGSVVVTVHCTSAMVGFYYNNNIIIVIHFGVVPMVSCSNYSCRVVSVSLISSFPYALRPYVSRPTNTCHLRYQSGSRMVFAVIGAPRVWHATYRTNAL